MRRTPLMYSVAFGAALAAGVAVLGTPGLRKSDAEAPRGAEDLADAAREAWAEARGRPEPRGHEEDEEAEERNHALRRAWIARMHRAPIGVDWEAIEQENGLAQVRRHAALTRSPPAPAGPRWVERGPTNQAGRTHVTRLASNGTQLYVGSALGGLWRGTLDGEAWEPLGDDAYGGVHFLEVIPGEPDVLVAASDGGIVLRSADGGATWEYPPGLQPAWWTRRLTQSHADPDVLFLVQAGWSGVKLFRSTNAGASWAERADLGIYGDIWAASDGSVYLVDADSVSVSRDDGDSWEVVGPRPGSGETVDLTGSDAGAPTLYAVTSGGNAWRSDDGGESFDSLGGLTDYWTGGLRASTVDPELFAYGGVELHLSHDGGQTYDVVNAWYDYYESPADRLHADIDGIDVIPDEAGGETWYINTDGGTYRSFDALESVENLSLSGLRIGQYYDVLTSSADPDHVAIGAQDQGYQVTNGVTQDDELWEVEQILSGDYGHLTSSDGTHEYVYSVYPGFILVQHGEDDPSLSYLDFPGGESYVPWLPPIVADPTDRRNFYFPATHIWKYEKSGRDTWSTSQWSTQDFRVDADEYVSRLAFSPVDPDRAWAATSQGRLWYSDDAGVTWEQSESLVADDNWYYGQAIAPSRTDADTVTIGGSGYGVPAVYRSTDGGRTFSTWNEGLPDTLVYTLVEASDNSGTVFAGTQTAAYKRGPRDSEWVDITTGNAPITTYWDSEALADRATIRFATYGRGVWDYELDPDGAACFPGDDHDGDGVTCDTDCDDNAAATFPGAEDACGDGVDADCDGVDPACDDTPPPAGKDAARADGCGCGHAGGSGWVGLLAFGVLLARRRGGVTPHPPTYETESALLVS